MTEILDLYSHGVSVQTIALIMNLDVEEILSILEEVYANQEALA